MANAAKQLPSGGAPSTALVRSGENGTVSGVRNEPAIVSGVAPMTFAELLKMGDALVKTGFLPEHVKNGGQAAAIILTGQELGMPPMRALRSLQMVKGKVVENADSQLARFKSDGGHAMFRRLDDKGATLWLRHPNGDEHEESFTFADAERAGLTRPSRTGEPSMYMKHPRAMFRSRTITAGLKSIGWEGGAGAYDPDEAIAFTAPAPSATSAGAAVSVVESEPAPERREEAAREVRTFDLNDLTLELAAAEPFPWKNPAKYAGVPLRQLSDALLDQVSIWAAGKLENDPDNEYIAWLAACASLLVESRSLGRDGAFPLTEQAETNA